MQYCLEVLVELHTLYLHYIIIITMLFRLNFQEYSCSYVAIYVAINYVQNW